MFFVDLLERLSALVAHVDDVVEALTSRLDANARGFRNVAVEDGAEFGVGRNHFVGRKRRKRRRRRRRRK